MRVKQISRRVPCSLCYVTQVLLVVDACNKHVCFRFHMFPSLSIHQTLPLCLALSQSPVAPGPGKSPISVGEYHTFEMTKQRS